MNWSGISYEEYIYSDGTNLVLAVTSNDLGRENIIYLSNSKHFDIDRLLIIHFESFPSVFLMLHDLTPYYRDQWIPTDQKIRRDIDPDKIADILDSNRVRFFTTSELKGSDFVFVIKKVLDGKEYLNYMSNNSSFNSDTTIVCTLVEYHSINDFLIYLAPFHCKTWPKIQNI